MSRATSQQSSAPAGPANGISRSTSVKASSKPTQTANPLAVSDTRLFVSNLRLLDFDLRSDWPNITLQTFSAKNADQKQRIGGVEWALFRLFEIWDPEETAQKLRPFFPPLEPLQSLNLRAALFRSLNELKKNGVLGRESVLRKTMLDECKGEKFFEILALFSTAVLKKALGPTQHYENLAVARTLATAPRLSSDRQASLLPLAIAHKAALTNVLRRKDEKRRRFGEFEGLLDTKANGINQRIRKCKDTPRAQRPQVPQREADAIKKQLKDNWVGNQKWLDVMLHGDHVHAEDAFLDSPFEKVWHMVQQGRQVEDAAPEAGLLENLQNRLQEQQMRLQKWKQFQEKMRNQDALATGASSKVQAPTNEFKFDHHLQLQLPSNGLELEDVSRAPLRADYEDLLAEMHEELAQIATSKHNRSSMPLLRRRASSPSASRSPVRRRSRQVSISKLPAIPTISTKPPSPERQRSRDKVVVQPFPRQSSAASTPFDSEATLVGRPSRVLHTSALQSVESLAQEKTEAPHDSSSPVSDPHDAIHESSPETGPALTSPPRPQPSTTNSSSPSHSPTSYFPSEPPLFLPPEHTTEELMAEAIISSINTATPSPIKNPHPRLSLMERTRMTMTRIPSFPPISESPTLSSPTLPSPPPDPTPLALPPKPSLLERTRLSMSTMPPTTATSRKPSSSSSRQSLFPVNQFDTPRTRRSIQALEDARPDSHTQHTPKEDLFSEDAEYTRVFKSRPKIATSPVFSPAEVSRGVGALGALGDGDGDGNGRVRAVPFDGEGYADEFDDGFDEGVTGVDLGDVDADEDEDGFTQAWENSPLRARLGFGFGRSR